MYKWPAMEELYNELIKSGQAVFSANVNLLCFGGFAYKILALKGTWDGITLLGEAHAWIFNRLTDKKGIPLCVKSDKGGRQDRANPTCSGHCHARFTFSGCTGREIISCNFQRCTPCSSER